MANVTFWDTQSRQREVKAVPFRIAIGGTGAPTLSTDGSSLGVTSVSRTSAGLYVLTLTDKWTSLADFTMTRLLTGLQDLTWQLNAETVASSKTVTFTTLTGATATDPTSGTVLYGTIYLKNTSV